MVDERELAPGRRARWMISAMFLLGVFGPAAAYLVTGERDTSVAKEQRLAATAPRLALERAALGELPDSATAWFADAFPLRRPLVRLHNAFLWFVLGVSPTDEMLRGEDDWIYFRGAGVLDIHRGELFEPDQLEPWVERYIAWRDWLAARDVQCVFALAGEKQSVHTEHLPDWLGPPAQPSRTDQFVEGLRSHGARVVDTRALLRDAAQAETVYDPLGTHWNDVGALLAYQAVLEELSRHLTVGRAFTRAAFLEQQAPEGVDSRDSWAGRMHLDGLVVRPELRLLPRAVPYTPLATWTAAAGGIDGVLANPDERLPSMVMLRDSFGVWLWPYLGSHFRRIVSESSRRFDVELVERELPDVVLHVRVERLLSVALSDLELMPGELEAARRWNAAEALQVDAELSDAGHPRAWEVAADADVGPPGQPSGPLWLRLTRAAPAVDPGAPRADWPPMGRQAVDLVLTGGGRPAQTVRVEFAPGRRIAFVGPIAFAGPIDLRAPLRVEPAEPDAAQGVVVAVAARRVRAGD
jgi:hypothetical protein